MNGNIWSGVVSRARFKLLSLTIMIMVYFQACFWLEFFVDNTEETPKVRPRGRMEAASHVNGNMRSGLVSSASFKHLSSTVLIMLDF